MQRFCLLLKYFFVIYRHFFLSSQRTRQGQGNKMSFIHSFPSPFQVVFFVFPYLYGTAGKPSVAGISANGAKGEVS